MKKIEIEILQSQVSNIEDIVSNVHIGSFSTIQVENKSDSYALVSIICKDSLKDLIVKKIIAELQKNSNKEATIQITDVDTFQLI